MMWIYITIGAILILYIVGVLKLRKLASDIYEGLIEIKEIQQTCDYSLFSKRLIQLSAISEKISKAPKNNIETAKLIASKKYQKHHQALNRRQKDFIEDPDIKSNHRLIGLLKSRFYIEFCEQSAVLISEATTEDEKQLYIELIKEVGDNFIKYLTTNNHIGLANMIRSSAKETAGIIIP